MTGTPASRTSNHQLHPAARPRPCPEVASRRDEVRRIREATSHPESMSASALRRCTRNSRHQCAAPHRGDSQATRLTRRSPRQSPSRARKQRQATARAQPERLRPSPRPTKPAPPATRIPIAVIRHAVVPRAAFPVASLLVGPFDSSLDRRSSVHQFRAPDGLGTRPNEPASAPDRCREQSAGRLHSSSILLGNAGRSRNLMLPAPSAIRTRAMVQLAGRFVPDEGVNRSLKSKSRRGANRGIEIFPNPIVPYAASSHPFHAPHSSYPSHGSLPRSPPAAGWASGRNLFTSRTGTLARRTRTGRARVPVEHAQDGQECPSNTHRTGKSARPTGSFSAAARLGNPVVPKAATGPVTDRASLNGCPGSGFHYPPPSNRSCRAWCRSSWPY